MSLPPSRLGVGLTARRVAILRLMAAGLDDAAIARRLHLARATVRNNRVVIYRELGLMGSWGGRNTIRSQAIAEARRRGLLHTEELPQ